MKTAGWDSLDIRILEPSKNGGIFNPFGSFDHIFTVHIGNEQIKDKYLVRDIKPPNNQFVFLNYFHDFFWFVQLKKKTNFKLVRN